MYVVSPPPGGYARPNENGCGPSILLNFSVAINVVHQSNRSLPPSPREIDGRVRRALTCSRIFAFGRVLVQHLTRCAVKLLRTKYVGEFVLLFFFFFCHDDDKTYCVFPALRVRRETTNFERKTNVSITVYPGDDCERVIAVWKKKHNFFYCFTTKTKASIKNFAR